MFGKNYDLQRQGRDFPVLIWTRVIPARISTGS